MLKPLVEIQSDPVPTISVVGSSSYTSGSTSAVESPLPSNGIGGNFFGMEYKMNDGSTLILSGWFLDSSESTLQVELNGSFGSGIASNICTLTRQ
jgi:hypothetical protein